MFDVQPYDGGLLVDLPFAYSDGDAVRVFIRRCHCGSCGDFLVTDRGAADEKYGTPVTYVTGADRIGATMVRVAEECMRIESKQGWLL